MKIPLIFVAEIAQSPESGSHLKLILLESLESRCLLSITWVNQGRDNFDRYYQQNAATARYEVDTAIADWNTALPNANVHLKISAIDLEHGKKQQNLLGDTSGTTIKLDSDGAGTGWYFDTSIDDDSDFVKKQPDGFFSTNNADTRMTDFYTAVLHEIGHALGFQDKQNPSKIQVSAKRWIKDSHHSNDPQDLMYPYQGEHEDSRTYITAYDRDHTKWAKYGVGPIDRVQLVPDVVSQYGLVQITPHDFGDYQHFEVTRVPQDQPDATPVVVAQWQRGDSTVITDSTAELRQTYIYRITGMASPSSTADLTLKTYMIITRNPAVWNAYSGASFNSLQSAGDIGSRAMTLTWTPLPNVDHYELWRASIDVVTSDAFDFAQKYGNPGYPSLTATLDASVVSYSDPHAGDNLGPLGYPFAPRYWVVAYLKNSSGGLDRYVYPESAPDQPGNNVVPSFQLTGHEAEVNGGPYGGIYAILDPTLKWEPAGFDHVDIYRSEDYGNPDRTSAVLIGSVQGDPGQFALNASTSPEFGPDYYGGNLIPPPPMGTPHYWIVGWSSIELPNKMPIEIPFAFNNPAVENISPLGIPTA